MTAGAEIIARERDEAAAFWCMRLTESGIGADERAAFESWIAADPQNGRAFDEALAIWRGVGAIADRPEMIAHHAEAVEALRVANARRRWFSGWARWRWPAAIAACCAMILLVAGLLLHDGATRYKTGIGERRVVMLEDGSRLTLDAASEVEVRLDEEWRRLELVAGRAKFDVAHDPLRPFSVRARDRLTVATGTSFSVELLPRQMRVVLYEGSVEVVDRAPKPSKTVRGTGREDGRTSARSGAVLTLAPGSELIASTTGPAMRVIEADLSKSLSWEAGQLSFDGEPLALAAERMNRYAKERIVIGDAHIASYEVSGVFAAGDGEAFIEGVTALYPIAVTREPDMFVLTSGK